MSTIATKRRAPLMLPGQSAAPEGPVDMTFMYVMHHGFRRDLTAFVAAAKATPAGDRAAWEALEQRWELFSHILHLHHTAEDDAIWPFLMDRVDAEGRATLQAMEAEHDQIDPLLQACADGFATLARKPDDDARAALVVRLTATRECLTRHLAHEETDAIALISPRSPRRSGWPSRRTTPRTDDGSATSSGWCRGPRTGFRQRRGQRRSPTPVVRSICCGWRRVEPLNEGSAKPSGTSDS
jgi:hypothetical protein